ncbi:PD40 domain-containing protein [Tenuifilum thalassicum]|uniref:Tetratricopeptide repeat protein n=1 Tax=Tenuifilum thalassicum TaxID=2590900 RepID=A0A7D4C146_9BACT|nr:PD40 domain-containing protein [Tenuifilum thalassicum]QKG80484.1 hypothetical protein FHG85_09470 [Tenuifilum thalassicum]
MKNNSLYKSFKAKFINFEEIGMRSMRAFIFTYLLLLSFSSTSAQRNTYFRRVFVDAEYYLLYEEYKDALPLYKELHKAFPNNYNIAYRLGLCYLNIPPERSKSIPYFEKAITAITDNYKEGYFTENKAPKEAYFYYGQALRSIGQLDKAQKAFEQYKLLLKSNEIKKLRLVKKELESIQTAKYFLANPFNHKIAAVGRNITTRFPEVNPVSDNSGNTIVYTSVQKFYNAILISNRRNEFWNNPLNLNPQLYADGEIRTVGITSNGNILLLSRNDNDIFNLYYSTYDKETNSWTPITKFPKTINTSKSWQTFGSLSKNGDTLYFSSNRPGGFGGFDIWMSVKTSAGWSEPINLGKNINSPFDETAPFLTENGKRLFFSSNGHKTMGGFDIFYSNLENNTWSIPQNLGYPLNTTDDEEFFFPIKNGKEGFFSKYSNGKNDEDIYHVTFEPKVFR